MQVTGGRQQVLKMDMVSQIASKLEDHGIESSRVNAEVMLSDILRCQRADLYINDIRLGHNQFKKLEEMVNRRINGEPLQYITGRANFYGHEFLIQPGVFIPRPETEVLVETVLNLITIYDIRTTVQITRHCEAERSEDEAISDDKRDCFVGLRPPRNDEAKSYLKIRSSLETDLQFGHLCDMRYTIYKPLILDLGTGSGNIAISLTKAFIDCKMIGSDISEKAIALAKRNASLHAVSDRIEFIKADLFDIPRRYEGSFDIIVSNPPYIAHEKLENLAEDVKREPQQAVDGGKYGTKFYSRIMEESHLFLKRDGIIALELADGIYDKVKEMFERSGRFYKIEVFKDLNNIERVITAKRSIAGAASGREKAYSPPGGGSYSKCYT